MKLFNTYKIYFLTLCVFSSLVISSSLKADNSNPVFAALRQLFSTAQLVPSDQSLQGKWYCKDISHDGRVNEIEKKINASIYGRVLEMRADDMQYFKAIKSSKGLRDLSAWSYGILIKDLRVDSKTGNLIVENNIENQASGESPQLPESIAEPGFFTASYMHCLKTPE
jgi:hypothetical protein